MESGHLPSRKSNVARALALLPNTVTGVRIAAAVVVWFGVPLLFQPELSRWCFRLLFFLAAVSDAIDGVVARKFGAGGKVGYYLDPVADKLFFNTMCLFFAFSENTPFPVRFPGWCAIAILLKDVSWATGGVVTKWLTGKVEIPPSFFGKLTTFCVIMLTTLLLTTPDVLDPILAQKILWRGSIVCVALASITLSGYAYEVFRSKVEPTEDAKANGAD